MLEGYLQHIQEGYLLSDKNISVNLDDFESGKKNKLIIIGVPGSGKTSLGRHLAKKYKVKEFVSDEGFIKNKKALDSPNRAIIESAGFIYMDEFNKVKMKKIVLETPMILMGMSAIKAGIRADKRDGTTPLHAKTKEDVYYFIRRNLLEFQKRYSKLRKEIMNIPGAKIKEYKVPKFKPFYM